MDAREQLRRYLEQRRELGESELVLDSLTVEEALRILGAGGGKGQSTPRRNEKEVARTVAPAAEPVERGADIPTDWREALRATGAAPDALASQRKGDAGEQPPNERAIERPLAAETEDSVMPSRPATTGGTESTDDRGALAPAGLSVGGEGGSLSGGPVGGATSLGDIAGLVASCTKCPLHSTALNPVPGSGNPEADFMCVGEAPGQTEDEQGLPFVGAAGQLLTKILGAIDLKREDVFIANVLKHRPPGNRNPMPNEVAACSPYLIRQIEIVRPKVILALGTFAAQTLLETKLSIGKLRGQIHRYHGVPLIVTYHPAALLRNPSWKRPTWEDVQLARRVLDRAAGGA